MKYILTVDLGTSSLKTIGYSFDGKIVFKSNFACELNTPRPMYCEQNPEKIFDAIIKSIKEALSKNGVPSALVFSSAMHGLIALDENGKPLTELITWADNRAVHELRTLKESGLAAEIFRNTGTPIHTMSPLLKIRWIKNHLPEIFSRTRKFCGLKEFIIHKLTGKYLVDFSVASASGLFNIHNFTWNEASLQFAGIDSSSLPEPVETDFKVSEWNSSKYFASIEGTFPIIIGSSDGCLANYGAQALQTDIPVITLGTSGALRVVSPRPVNGPETGLFSYILDKNRFVCGGPVNNAGILFKWFTKFSGNTEYADDSVFSELDNIISNVSCGAEGLLCLPYFLGERAPVWDPDARGIFLGVSYNHNRDHFLRAIAEGMILNLYQIAFPLIKEFGQFSRLKVGGGVIRCKSLLQIIADVFNVEVEINEDHDHSSKGAFLLAHKLLTGQEGFSENKPFETVKPIPENVATYRQIFEVFRGIYNKHKEDFIKLNNLPDK